MKKNTYACNKLVEDQIIRDISFSMRSGHPSFVDEAPKYQSSKGSMSKFVWWRFACWHWCFFNKLDVWGWSLSSQKQHLKLATRCSSKARYYWSSISSKRLHKWRYVGEIKLYTTLLGQILRTRFFLSGVDLYRPENSNLENFLNSF